MRFLHDLWLFFTFRATIHNGAVCRLSARIPWLFDLHDYPERKGGDGHPCHMYTYTCPNCGKEFGI